VRIGVITGSGSYALPGAAGTETDAIETRFGTAAYTHVNVGDVEVVHVTRHGAGHKRLSNHVNHQANIAALAELGVSAIIGVTVCGAVDPTLELGSLIVFDDLHFLSNRLPDGRLCTLYDEPGDPRRGHWIYGAPYHDEVRSALISAAEELGHPVRGTGVYGHVDGPRLNTKTEIAHLAAAGVTAVSQTGGPETVLAGEAEIPYGLIGYVTDYANGVAEETPVDEFVRLMEASRPTFAAVLQAAVPKLVGCEFEPVGTVLRFE
jgi:5'-methylthioadenosine phosphorylase